MRHLKSIIFRHYWWAIAILAVVALTLWIDGRILREPQTLIAILGGLFTLAFFVQKQKLDELKLFRELFADFNQRYDKLNEHLERLATNGKMDDARDRQRIVDYFNLCAEEYFWYSAGLIPENVWTSWCRGMYYDSSGFCVGHGSRVG